MDRIKIDTQIAGVNKRRDEGISTPMKVVANPIYIGIYVYS